MAVAKNDIHTDYQSIKYQKTSELRLKLAHDLQSVYLTEVMSSIHPTILQMALEQFAKVAIERKSDQRINISRVIEILKGGLPNRLVPE